MKNRHFGVRHIVLESLSKSNQPVGLRVELDSNQVAHYLKVLRFEDGQKVHATDGKGNLYEGVFHKKGPQSYIEIGRSLLKEQRPLELELIIGFSKNSTMDDVVEKATELGVLVIQPVVCVRSVVQPSEYEKYYNRWKKIVISALEQSEGVFLPELRPILTLRDWVLMKKNSKIVACVSEGRAQMKLPLAIESLESFRKEPISLVVGPEGGFTEEERSLFDENGVISVSLGTRVLRVATAVTSILTLAQSMRVWR
ncbi:MAG: 16S rRNA (uracil(1498)-N(3))-methyltransferase [Bacteriovoracia bacterium]